MKKVLALVLALATVLSLGVTAFAAEGGAPDVKNFSDVYLKDAKDVFPGYDVDKDVLETVPDKTYYYVIPDVTFAKVEGENPVEAKTATAEQLADTDLFKVKIDKEEGGKWFSSLKVDQVKIDGDRTWVIAAKLKDDQTDNEYKLKFSVKFTSKDKFDKDNDFEVEFDTETIFMSNKTIEEDDIDRAAGTGGEMFKPVKNEENTVLWEDENETLATLTFDADSSVVKYFPKLSTKWDNSKYAELFNDQDAFIRGWVGTPSISSTSRAQLDLNVPYIDEDDELTVDEDAIVVYEETADGELVDITSKGTFLWNDDDEFVFRLKTRTLGTYIFAEAPVTEADADAEVPADDVVDADKVNPGTGF
ncbi:hypothetical protein [Anaerotruncus rubiinfantis]|uniref:hypothetical protein n=1 Tax=Anaerotruncus rubiinfantis TaxID=1720200 RepID=UPI003D78BE25